MKFSNDFEFTSEAVLKGHPDKMCDRIADAILDELLANDPEANSALEVVVAPHKVLILGETYSKFHLSHSQIDFIAREIIMNTGYIHDENFSWDNVNIAIQLNDQSTELHALVQNYKDHLPVAGDQGIMFGYAINHTPELLPSCIYYANLLAHKLDLYIRENNIEGLGPDGKCQITLQYKDGKPAGVNTIVLSLQNTTQHKNDYLESIVQMILPYVLPAEWLPISNQKLLINKSGSFTVGGPGVDTGLTGRKNAVDTYGGYAPHGGGSFSGKDASKMDRTAAYAARYLAKNIVASGLATECLIQLSYCIGMPSPISLMVKTNSPTTSLDVKLTAILPKLFDLSPNGIKNSLHLEKPIYYPTACYGHFGRPMGPNGEFSWEALSFVRKLQQEF